MNEQPPAKNKQSPSNIEQLKVPPHSIEAEQSVLGSMLIAPDSWDKVAEIVVESDFYNRSHRIIFSAILKLLNDNKAVDVITVKDVLETHAQLEEVGGFAYLIELADNTPSTANVSAYANVIKERAIVRELIGVANDIAELGYHPEGRDSTDILDIAESKVFEIAEKRTGDNEGPIDVTKVLTKTVTRLDELVKKGSDITGVSTGYTDLDQKTSGLQPSDLIIVAARPSMGKCLVAGTKIADPDTGELHSIEQLVQRQSAKLFSVNDQFQLVNSEASAFVDDGVKPTFEVVTKLGRRIQSTASHPFLTGKGWVKLAELAPNTPIAVPSVLPVFGNTSFNTEHDSALLNALTDTASDLPAALFKLTKDALTQCFSLAFGSFEHLSCIDAGSLARAQQLQHLWLRLGQLTRLVETSSEQWQLHWVEAEQALPSSVREYIESKYPAALPQWLKHSHIDFKLLRTFAEQHKDNYLLSLADADIYWDAIDTIEYMGEQQVYDLTVPDLHNFVAQDICVHNTTFAMNLCENAMMLQDKPVLVFSLEMPAEQIMMRMLASLSRVNQTNIRTAQISDEEWARISGTIKQLKEKDNLFIDDSSGLTPMELRTRARKLHRERGGMSLIMVDYLQLMRVPSLSENRTLEIAEISLSLKALAKELEVPVFALSHLNRGLEQRADKRPINSDLRESGSIEQDADLIMFIYRDEVYHENSELKGIAEIIIGKQRNGPIGTSRLTFQGQFSRFDNYAGPDYDDEY